MYWSCNFYKYFMCHIIYLLYDYFAVVYNLLLFFLLHMMILYIRCFVGERVQIQQESKFPRIFGLGGPKILASLDPQVHSKGGPSTLRHQDGPTYGSVLGPLHLSFLHQQFLISHFLFPIFYFE